MASVPSMNATKADEDLTMEATTEFGRPVPARPTNPARWAMFTTFGADRVDLELNVEKAINHVGIDSVISYSEYYDPREGRYVGKILYRDFEDTRL